MHMQDLIEIKDEVFDLTQDSDDEDSKLKQKPQYEEEIIVDVENESDDKYETKENFKHSHQEIESIVTQTGNIRSFRNLEKSVEKAVAEIKRGGSLAAAALHYGVSENVVYNKLVSRRLPKEVEILTENEETNLVKWILRSNDKNLLILKNQLMEKVGKLKKVMRVTPIFAKSKFGRMWFNYFLEKYTEVYECDGLILTTPKVDENHSEVPLQWPDDEDIKLSQETFKVDAVKSENDPTQLLLSFGIKDAVVVLHDIRQQKNSPYNIIIKENIPSQPSEEESDQSDSETEMIYRPDQNNSDVRKQDESERVGKGFLNNLVSNSGKGKKKMKISNSNGNIESEYVVKDITNNVVSNSEKENNKIINNNDRPTCEHCNQSFCNKEKLKRHLYTHMPKELYSIGCDKCSKKFPSTDHLNVHLKTSHSEQYFECKECGKIFKHQTSLFNHKRKVHPKVKNDSDASNFICDMCGKSFRYKNSIEAHIMYGHMKIEKKFPCSVCEKTFIKFSAMVRHKLRHSKIKPFTCVHCKKTFPRKYLLRNHIELCFKNENKNHFSCVHCKRTFLRKYLLRKHIKHCFMDEKKTITQECDQISKEYLAGIELD